eukprot:CAMPEP_0198426904 /NCGR_PEP_ID=MMETSP1452-20131203/5555_1 /TAXON_ID=1181717 /ORGANISM="Synchroma pusillum, Strain CCMP3072" /LENGTH=199 /DNA_ID=CAMNT_0044147281 /DNA_START=34 /DNA_END=633 /DNA_ORIENTATION=-
MFRAVVLAVLAGAALGFVPSRPTVRSSALRMDVLEGLPASVEVGGKPWDPLGLSKLSAVSKNNPDLKWLQEAEIKHCRQAMLAFVGLYVPKFFTIPGYNPEADWVKAMPKFAAEQPLALAQIILAIAIVEGYYYPGEFWFGGGDRAPGDYGFDPLGLYGKSDEAKKTMQLKELKNGRLAMIAVIGHFFSVTIPGSVPGL